MSNNYLSTKELKHLYHGNLRFKKNNGYLLARRFTEEQEKYLEFNDFLHLRTFCSASITIEFYTMAKSFSFDYKLFSDIGVKSTFEVYEDGFLTSKIITDDLERQGNLTFVLKNKIRKKVVLYLPNYSEYGIKNFYIDGEFEIVAHSKKKVLFLGDSITQGGGTERSGHTYVSLISRELGYEVVNQGIGGYIFDKNIIKELPFKPKKIIVAFGTNDVWYSAEENEKRIFDFFNRLYELYHNVKVLVVLPPFMGNSEQEAINAKFRILVGTIKNQCERYENIYVVNAYKMIPHFVDYFTADYVHPNVLGAVIYADNLIKSIKKINF